MEKGIVPLELSFMNKIVQELTKSLVLIQRQRAVIAAFNSAYSAAGSEILLFNWIYYVDSHWMFGLIFF